MADEPTATKRVELIDQGDPSSSGLSGYIGIGLIGGVVLGFGPLRDAVQGTGPFEDAMVRFMACLLVCLAAASFIGRILDSAPSAEEMTRSESAPPTRASAGAVTDTEAEDSDPGPPPQ